MSDASHFVFCPRCGSEVYLGGVQWDEPEEHLPGERASLWVACPVEAPEGGDPMGEFDDGEPCGEGFLVYRRVNDQADGYLHGPQREGGTDGR